jgi:hypothetical protein
MYTCQPPRLAVVSDLPIKRLTRATRRAMQVAVTGQSALAVEQGRFAALFISSFGTSGGNFRRKGITRGKRQPDRTDPENQRDLSWGSARRSVKKKWGFSSWTFSRLRGAALRGSSWQFAGCPLVTRSQAEVFPVRRRTGGRQRKFGSAKKAAERKNAMHQTAHCQEVHA